MVSGMRQVDASLCQLICLQTATMNSGMDFLISVFISSRDGARCGMKVCLFVFVCVCVCVCVCAHSYVRKSGFAHWHVSVLYTCNYT